MDFGDKINIEDFLLCTPYEKRGNRDLKIIDPNFLTEKLFYDELFSHPQQKLIDFDELRDLDFDEMEIKTIKRNINGIEKFKSALLSNNIEPLFVRGYSGTGKTTFIRTLLYELNLDKPNNHAIILNLQDSLPNVYLFKKKWENKKYRQTIYKFISMLLKYIGSIIDKGKRESVVEYKIRLKHVYKNYSASLGEVIDPEIDNVFTIISNFIDNSDYIYHDRVGDNFCSEMYQAITAFASPALDSDDNNIISNSINKLFKLIYIYLLCKSNIEDKHFILLDNIEHYIKNDVIYDDEITLIVQIVRDFIADMEDYFDQNDILLFTFQNNFCYKRYYS